jgi:hypothetical protein
MSTLGRLSGNFLLIWVSVTGLGACDGSPTAAPTLPPLYFDLKALLDDQRAYLESTTPGVTRSVRAGKNAADIQRVTRVNWEHELHFFYDADLNRPALRGRYTETTTTLPDGAVRRTYRCQPARAVAPVRELTVEVARGGGVRQITAVQDDQNILFASERQLTLRLDPAPDHNRLLSYAISGRQKLVFFAETTYDVRGEVE